jgi:hypothetical protein
VVLPNKRRLPFIRSALPIECLAVRLMARIGCQPMLFGAVETGLRDRTKFAVLRGLQRYGFI